MKNSLSYKIKIRPSENLGGATKKQRIYFDFTVDGKSLFELLEMQQYDMVGAICISEYIDYEKEKISEFLLDKNFGLKDERVIIYGCGECLDIDCGAITAKIDKVNDTIIWKEFAYENGYSETNFYKYEEIGSFVFEQKAYQNVFKEIEHYIEQKA